MIEKRKDIDMTGPHESDLCALISRNLRYLRVHPDLTQSEVASRLDVSRSTYSLMERGRTELTLHQALDLCRYYDISVSQLACRSLPHCSCCGPR